jgi:hypothetical protein
MAGDIPSVSLLRVWIAKIDLTPGFCNTVFDMLRQKSAKLTPGESLQIMLWFLWRVD